MDVLYFFKERTQFIRDFYEAAGMPFCETKRKIQDGEPPFDNMPYREDGEPPYLERWIEADEALEVLGRTCLSMLSASLKLYFITWEKELEIVCKNDERKQAFKNGFLQGYKYCFEGALGVSWNDCPANFDLIEQIILARNRDQHPEEISSMRVTYGKDDLQKYPRPFFLSDTDQNFQNHSEIDLGFWMSPSVHVSREMLYCAIAETEALADWLEKYMFDARQDQPIS